MSATEQDTAQIQRDELHRALHERLVHTGEWHRIMAALRAQLDESGWTAAVREEAQSRWKQCKEAMSVALTKLLVTVLIARAGKQDNLSLPKLVEGLTPYAESEQGNLAEDSEQQVS